jgi:hypothetical protein
LAACGPSHLTAQQFWFSAFTIVIRFTWLLLIVASVLVLLAFMKLSIATTVPTR